MQLACDLSGGAGVRIARHRPIQGCRCPEADVVVGQPDQGASLGIGAISQAPGKVELALSPAFDHRIASAREVAAPLADIASRLTIRKVPEPTDPKA